MSSAPNNMVARCVRTLDKYSSTVFPSWGKLAARRPAAVIASCVLFLTAAACGLLFVSVQSDPEQIWVPPTSTTALQQDHFNAVFDPFYRIEQVIFTKKPGVG